MSLFVIKMVACVILLALSRVIIQNSQILDTQQLNNIEAVQSNTNVKSMAGGDGYWVPSDEFPPPYTFSQQVCNKTYLDKDDCIKANYCPSDLMNWVYMKGGKPYPRLNATGFLQKMKNKRIVFVGNSIMRQQILALMWTLGYDNIGWERPSVHKRKGKDCTAGRNCFTDEKHNITFCHQFMGTIATKVYHEGNYTLDHSLRGHGDSSCLLEDSNIAAISSFDLVCHTGVNCTEKTLPEPFDVDRIPPNHGWDLASKFWNTSLRVLLEERLDIKVVDAREPLMQSVHAHPSSGYAYPGQPSDCFHFCMNSAAVNMYLDLYWNEVLSEISV